MARIQRSVQLSSDDTDQGERQRAQERRIAEMKEELEDRDVNIRNLKAEIADKDRTIQDLRRAVSFRSGVKGESYSMKGEYF